MRFKPDSKPKKLSIQSLAKALAIKDQTSAQIGCKVDGHTYVVNFKRGQLAAVGMQLYYWAENPDLNFSWSDAVTLTEHMKKLSE